MPLDPGPESWKNTPAVVLCWNVLWSTSASSPATVSQLPTLEASWKTFRLIRSWVSPTGTLMPELPLSTNPDSVTYDTPEPQVNPVPLIVALPTCSACTVTGFPAAPD